MKMTKDNSTELEEVFARIKDEPVVVRDALLDRIMMDADTVLGQRAESALVVDVAPRQGIGAMLLDAIGGWASFGGLAAATVGGVWIGVSPPDALNTLSATFWGNTIEVPLLESDATFGLEG